MKNNYVLNITLLFTVILFSCSSNPSDDPFSSAKEIVKQQVTIRSRGYFKLASMEKKDAVTKTIDGVEEYTIVYTGEVECILDGGWVYGFFPDDQDGKLFQGLRGMKILDQYEEGNAIKQTKIGDKYKFDGGLVLEKHEQGWVLKRIN